MVGLVYSVPFIRSVEPKKYGFKSTSGYDCTNLESNLCILEPDSVMVSVNSETTDPIKYIDNPVKSVYIYIYTLSFADPNTKTDSFESEFI